MKTCPKILAVALGIVITAIGFPTTCRAGNWEDGTYEDKTEAIAADVLVYRPAGVILTVGGSVLFLLALPFSAIGGRTKQAANTLVATPFNFTFNRPIGTDLREYTSNY